MNMPPRRPAPRTTAAVLMLISGVTHVVQLAFYPGEKSALGASVFGAIYFVIGLLLLGRKRYPLWLGALLPSIGGALGVWRFIGMHRNPFSVFHVLIDLVVVPCCIWLLVASSRKRDEDGPESPM